MFGFGVGAYDIIDARGELILVQMPYAKQMKELDVPIRTKSSSTNGETHRTLDLDLPSRKSAVDCLYSAHFSPIAAFRSV